MRLGPAIEEVMEAEQELADALLKIGERHRTDHDVFHLTRLLSRWSQGHLAALEPIGRRFGSDAEAEGVGRESAGRLAVVREKSAELLGRRKEPGLLLLADLRELHLQAAAVSINWTILGQGAQAARDDEILDCVSLCHPETLRTMRWTVTKIKSSAPQILATA
jgi:hypothetical protein